MLLRLNVRTEPGRLEDVGDEPLWSSVDGVGDLGVSVPEVLDVRGVADPFMPSMTSSATCRASAWRLGTLRGGLAS